MTVTNVLKVFGESLSTVRKPGSGGNRNPDVAATTKKLVAKYKWNPKILTSPFGKSLASSMSPILLCSGL